MNSRTDVSAAVGPKPGPRWMLRGPIGEAAAEAIGHLVQDAVRAMTRS